MFVWHTALLLDNANHLAHREGKKWDLRLAQGNYTEKLESLLSCSAPSHSPMDNCWEILGRDLTVLGG